MSDTAHALGGRVKAAGSDPGVPGQWVTLFRITLALVLLVGGGVSHARAVAPLRNAPVAVFYTALGAAFLLSLASAAWMRARSGSPGLLGDLQLAVDVVVSTTLVYATGVQDSVLTFLFPLNTLYAAALVSRPAGYAMAATGAASFAGLVALSVTGVLPRLDDPGMAFEREAVSVVTATAGANFLVAMLGGQLAEQLRASALTLSQTRLDLKELQSLNTAVVQSMTYGLLCVDEHQTIQLANPAAARILGQAYAGLPGQGLRAVLPTVNLAAIPASQPVEVSYVLPAGATRQLSVLTSPLGRTAASLARGAVVFLQDITEQRQLEQAVAISQRLATVGQFAAGLAHELRNPLGSMIGCVELLQQGMRNTQDPDQERMLSIIHREAQRLAKLVQDFLVYARPQPPVPVTLDVQQFMEDVAADFSRDAMAVQSPIRVEPGAPAHITGDPAQLRQALWNLLRNAAEMSPPGAPITLRAVAAQMGPLPCVTLWVEDEGPGVPAETASRLFEPFFTTNPQGTGLGLATVLRIVEAHGGVVGLRAAGGPGAAFYATLPVNGPAPAQEDTH